MKKKEQTGKSILPDVIVISAILAITLLLLLFSFLLRSKGNTVVVEIDGTVVCSYPLSEDGVFPLNGGTNTLIIENERARLENSDCPDHTCERTGKIGFVGQTIVCLPNRLSVTVKGEAKDSGVDLIS